MISEKHKDDLQRLEDIAIGQGNQINISVILLAINAKGDELQEILEYFAEKNIEIIHSDVEPDNIDSYENSINPFDPSKINIKMDKLTMDLIIKRIKNEEFEFDSDFQRKAGLWSDTQKSQLIESILLRIPLPAFYFDTSDDDKWLIIDGLQRITTIKQFVVDKNMKLRGMEFFKDLNGKYFNDLPRSMQRRIEETNINAYLVDPVTPLNAKFNIFKRINTGGLTLEPQEIRNALFQGAATKFIKELAELPVFIEATCGSIKGDRMLDREFCLRYVAFTCLPLDEYDGVIDDFLNSAMIFLNKSTLNERNQIKDEFINVLSSCHNILGNHAFRKMATDGRRRPISKVLFEGWTYSIKKTNAEEIDILIQRNDLVKKYFIELCAKNDFVNLLKASDRKALYLRIERIENLLRNVIHRGDLK